MFKTPGTHGKALWLTAAAPAPAQSNPMFNMGREHVLPNVTQVTRFPGPIPGGRSFADWTFVTKSLFILYATNFASLIGSSREPLFSFNDQHATHPTHIHTHWRGSGCCELRSNGHSSPRNWISFVLVLLFFIDGLLLFPHGHHLEDNDWAPSFDHPPNDHHHHLLVY